MRGPEDLFGTEHPSLTHAHNEQSWKVKAPDCTTSKGSVSPASETSQRPLGETILEARSVAKAFGGVPALKDGQINLRAGSIHALCGGNGAGKSTFLNILTGILRRDSGTLLFKGKEVDFSSPKHSLDAGISIITQELSPILDMSVAENLFLGRPIQRYGFMRWKEIYRKAGELLERLEFKIDPYTKVRDLPLAQMQLVEIAKALNRPEGVDVLIMDEPTSALGETETETLFRSVRHLATLGTGIIYVSHRMTEIFQLCDEYTVFRDGAFIEAGEIANTNRKALVSSIIGRQFNEQRTQGKQRLENPILEARKVSMGSKLQDITLSVHEGEVLGIYGLAGSGRTEFLNVLYGLEAMDGGDLKMNGQPYKAQTPKDALKQGIALVPEDRKASGLVLTSSVRDNISLSSLPKLSKLGFIRPKLEAERTATWMQDLGIKAASSALAVQHMSGGNQQKVVLARALETKPRLLLLDEPTRGVDAGAKQEIYTFIEQFAAAGQGIIMVSSEVDEILAACSRVIVLHRGKVVADLPNDNLTAADLLHAAS